MNEYHDPMRQEGYIRQCLAHDKKPVGFIIGAGAPMSVRVLSGGDDKPLIPDIEQMTKQVSIVLSKDDKLSSSYNLICTHFTGEGNPTIEDILSHIRSLCHVAGDGEVRGLTASDLKKLDLAICNEINDIVNKKLIDENSPYHKLAAWVRAITRTNSVEIFTTNYDLLMEQAMEEFRVPYFDGFVGSRLTFFDPFTIDEDKLPTRWARIWKLHGSINWLSDENNLLYRSLVSNHSNDRIVIHPSHLKYDESRKMPYLAMIDRLKTYLKKTSALLITCGYSFRDQHLNEIMVQGLEGNPTAIIFALQFGELKKYPEAIKIALTSSNLSLLAEDEAIIGMKRLPWTKKNTEDIGLESIAVNWKKEPNQEISMANFMLGDFKHLGNLFEDIIGRERKGENGQ